MSLPIERFQYMFTVIDWIKVEQYNIFSRDAIAAAASASVAFFLYSLFGLNMKVQAGNPSNFV